MGEGKNSQLPITDSQFPITNYRFPIPNYRFPIPNYQLPKLRNYSCTIFPNLPIF
ncbi:MAG: alpha/beta hydrolase [Richelia sp. CSU_2_1]|nr:alpha/beta hydrolase [Microcoleus sp. SU_5_6]NJR20784.1 alpha/beta hydrolase [Richelia sp. CSU_2_1]